MKKKMIAIVIVLAMLLATMPTVYAEECAHTTLDRYSRCVDCGLGVCPDCRVAPKQIYYVVTEATCEGEGVWTLFCQSTPCCEASGKTLVTKRGTVPALGHSDENSDHYCDRCHKAFCVDVNPYDHKCDYCQTILSECADVSPCDHKCDICRAVISECRDEDPLDHKCDICQKVLSECRDAAPPDYICDVCGQAVSEHTTEGCTHIDIDAYRICGNCKKPVCPKCNGTPEGYEITSQPSCETTGMIVMMCVCQNTPTKTVVSIIPALGHTDANKDHTCDRCGKTSCTDDNPADHQCDVCQTVLSECVDESRVDHKCDICRKVLSECVDEDPEDHKCDVCQTVLSECVDESPADHMCDVCGKVLSECLDDDPVDLKCDICGAAVPEKPCAHVNIDNYRICQRCKQPICPKCGGVPEGYEVKTQPACELDGMIVMMCICQNTLTKIVTWTIPALGHIDENHDHICDRSACGTTLSACADTDPKDHQCDICGKVLSGHTGGTATCTAKAVCSHCGEAYGELKADGHTGEARWTQTADQHEKKWSCCGAVVISPEDHTWENGTCQECGYVCRHTGGTATCTAKAVCEECGEAYGELKADGHTGEARWTQTADQHEKKWSCCGAVVVSPEDHTWENGTCQECGYVCRHTGGTATCTAKAVCEECGEAYGKTDSTRHDLERVAEKAATVTETGNTEYWCCRDCEKYFADEESLSEIELTDTIIDKLPPEIIEGRGQRIPAGEKTAFSFRSNAAFDDFIRVELDGGTLDGQYYTVTEGSTIVTLKADYASTLSVGEHTIGIVSTNGTAATTFTVYAKAADAEAGTAAETAAAADGTAASPLTGDNSPLALWLVLLLAAAGIVGTTAGTGKKSKIKPHS